MATRLLAPEVVMVDGVGVAVALTEVVPTAWVVAVALEAGYTGAGALVGTVLFKKLVKCWSELSWNSSRVPGAAVHCARVGHWLNDGARAVGDSQGGGLRVVSIGFQIRLVLSAAM